MYPDLIKEHRRMWTCNRLELQTLGSQPIMPKSLPDHISRPRKKSVCPRKDQSTTVPWSWTSVKGHYIMSEGGIEGTN
jgi:hypothetical protein